MNAIEAPARYDPVVETAVATSRERRRQRLGGRNLWSAAVLGGGFAVTAVAILLLLPAGRSAPWLSVVALTVAYAVATRVEFEIGAGMGCPSQVLLVPMLFLLPLRIVPVCVAASWLVRDGQALVRGGLGLERLLLRLANSWYAVGPVLVLAAAGEPTAAWRLWPVLLAAVAAQFVFEFASAAGREWVAFGTSPRTIAPFLLRSWAVDVALAPVGLAIAIAATGHALLALVSLPLIGLLSFFARERSARIDHALELGHAYRGTALLLGDVVEADDAYTGAHSRDVVQLVLDVCDELGLSAGERRDAEFAALLHDVGKIKIPAEIISKPGPLTPEERAIVETHTIEGERLLAQVGGLLGRVGRIVRSCHERWDGAGYPDGLAAEQIPPAARIVCACDAYSAITTDRPYRRARPPAAALEELRRGAGAQFDPQVVDALARVLTRSA